MLASASAWEERGNPAVRWDFRSLEAFGDQPLEDVVATYDLLVIDHPFCGAAAQAELLIALDELIAPDQLEQLRQSAIGPSQRSYEYAGKSWALATDAACQVSAYRPDLLTEPAPATWETALKLARDLGTRSALPLSPAHAICSLLTLWAAAGHLRLDAGELVDPDAGAQQLDELIQLHAGGHPQAIRWEPPHALAALASGTIDYVPLAFGYISYASRVRFADAPVARGATLGGAGLAVSSASERPEQAASFALWVASQQTQRKIVVAHGGQPSDRSCWQDAEIDQAAHGFFSATATSLERAWCRPRDPWWPRFQLAAGRALTDGLVQRRSAERLLADLIRIHDEIALGSAIPR